MAKWTITDSSTGSDVVWTFPVNPNEFSPPARKGTFKKQSVLSPTGPTVLFQGQDAVPSLKFSGIVNTETFYNELRAELDKWYTLVLTDDQGSYWDVVIESYNFNRKRTALNQWRYDYDVSAIVVT